MRISPDLDGSFLPQSRRLCNFLNALDGGLANADLLTLAAELWIGEPTLTIWEGDEVRPRAALLSFLTAKLFFMIGTETLRQGFALVSGYGYPAGLPGEGFDDNTHLGQLLLTWYDTNVLPLLGGDPRQVRLCGHSFGGAFCAEVSYRTALIGQPAPQIVTFGAPKAFGRRAAAIMTNIPHGMRFMLPHDPVPQIWPAIFENPLLATVNGSLVGWRHPYNDGFILDGTEIRSAYLPENVSAIPGLDVASWILSFENNPAHTLTSYLSAINLAAYAAEQALSEIAPPVQDRELVHRMRLHEPKPDNVIAPFDLGAQNAAIETRHEFVSQHSPQRSFIKVFTYRRKGRKYQVYCNGHAIAWGYHRSTAARTARAGNDLIFRLLTQSLEIDSDSLISSLQEWFDLAGEELPQIAALIHQLRVPLAIR